MDIGTYIKQFLFYNSKGKSIFRYGIVIGSIPPKRPSLIKKITVLWNSIPELPKYKTSYIETIKMELIEVITKF